MNIHTRNYLNFKDFKNLILTQEQKNEIDIIFKTYDCKEFKKSIKAIKYLIEAEFYPNWLEKVNVLNTLNLGTFPAYLILYGDEKAKVKWEERKKKSSGSLESYVKKHGKLKGEELYNKACESKKAQGKESYYIEKYGEVEGKEKWKEIKTKWKESNLKTKLEGKRKGNGRSLKEYIFRYGEKEGEQLWKKRNEKQRKRFSLQWYIEKYGDSIGNEKWVSLCKQNDRGSLKFFTNKYGEEEGLKKYKERCIQVNSGGMGLSNLILKHGEEEGSKRYKNWVEKTMNAKTPSLNYSKVSQKLFWEIYEALPNKLQEKVKFAELNEEQMIKVWKEDLTVIFVDFKVENKIIEFQGTYWHSKQEVKEKDERRIKYLKEYNYKILCINQKDFEKQKLQTINECIKFILND